jgi:hypothetical protein
LEANDASRIDPPREHAAHVGQPVAQPHVGSGIVRHRRPAITQPLHVVVVEPDAVRHREAFVDEAQLVHMGGERRAVALVAGHDLDLGFSHMAVDADIVFAREVAAGDQEIVAAVMRDGGCHGQHDRFERPFLQCLLHLRGDSLPRRIAEALDLLLQRWRQAIHQAGNGFEEAGVGHHRRQHGAHADLFVGLGHGRQAVDRGQGELRGKVVGGGAALHHHLAGADQAREIFVLERATAVDPWAGRQQQLERPKIAHALAEIARPMRVGIDQAGMHEPVPGVDHRGACRRDEAGPADLGDGVALDQDVGRRRFAFDDV